MAKVLYTDGPQRVNMGAAGVFKRGEPKEIDDKLAERLLKKTSLKFYEDGQVPAAELARLKKTAPAKKEA